ncbi:MAG: DNA alkylation repair protein [Lachnospiraceae bacterium]|nr:DNA alkylation repair protein [Lachnospiraceae bacterium]
MGLNEDIRKQLLEMQEDGYKKFSAALVPGCDNMLGIRLPLLKKLAKELAKGDWQEYLPGACDDYFEETMLQGFTLGFVKADIAEILPYVKVFIPKINNWSVCDSFCANFKIATKEREKMWHFLMNYREGSEFEQRVVAVMLMDHFFIEEYIDRVTEVLVSLDNPGYYTRMAVAWAIATAYAKFPGKIKPVIEERRLDTWTHNKAIQKMVESYRVSDEDKMYLKALKY